MFQPPRFRFAPTTTRQSPLLTGLQWAGNAVSFVLLCAAALAAIVLLVIPFVSGSQTYTVLTSSMAPAYAPGTFLVVKPTDFTTLEVGDVVTYQLHSGRPEVVTHRITGFTADQDGDRLLITKGDNNDLTDPNPVMEIQMRGELFYAVPGVGFVANHLGNSNRGLAVTVAAVALIGYGIITMARQFRRKGDVESAGAAQ